MEKTNNRPTISLRRKKPNDMAFTMDDVRNILQQKQETKEQEEVDIIAEIKHDLLVTQANTSNASQQKVQAASLADILGFQPQSSKQNTADYKDPSEISPKYRKYYKMLIKLKHALQDRAKSNGTHYTSDDKPDPDLKSFDIESTLNLLPNEQEGLTEVEQAIQRIYNDTYGICEVTGNAIESKRLEVMPFTRYSLEGQQEQEKLHSTKEQNSSGTIFDGEQSDDINGYSEYEEE